MKVLGYGEDALTLWALTKMTNEVLRQLKDTSPYENLSVIYRPSFGRKGGKDSSQFGEFDFILATPKALYLGEAKWDKSPEIKEWLADKAIPIKLRPEQTDRHKIFQAYYEEWITKEVWEEEDFRTAISARLEELKLTKQVPPATSALFKNLKAVLTLCAESTSGCQEIRNVLLVTDCTGTINLSQSDCPPDFTPVCIDATESLENGLIALA